MKKLRWNTAIFLAYVAYCALFIALFWTVFVAADGLDLCFEWMLRVLFGLCGVNSICQLIAGFKLEKYAGRWLIGGIVLLFAAIAFTYGQGV